MKVSRAILFAGVFTVLAPSPLDAAIWDGGLTHGNFTVNDLWSTGNNWQDVIPVSDPTTDVVFVLSGIRTTATQNLANPFTLRSLTFSSGSNVIAVTGNQLNIANAGFIAQNSAVSAVVSNAINWNGTGVVTGIGTAQLALASPMSGVSTVRYVGGSGGTTLFVNVGGANTYIGGTFVGEGTGGFSPVDVTFSSNTAPSSGSIQFFNGNTIRGGNGARTFANLLGLSSNANGLSNVFTFGNGDDMTFNGPIVVANGPQTLDVENAVTTFAGSMSGSASLTKTGPGKLVLNGANAAFTGQWTINGGRVQLGNAAALPTTAVTVNAANGLDTSGQPNVTITSLNGIGDIDLGTSALTVGSGNFSGIFSGKLTAASVNDGPLTKIGTGSFTLAVSTNRLKTINVENGTMNLDGSRTTLGAGVTVGASAAVPAMNMINGGFLACGSNAGSIVSGPPGTSLNIAGGFQWNSGFQLVIAAGFGPGFSSGVVNVRSAAFLNGAFVLVGAGGADGVGTLNVESQGSVFTAAGIVGFTAGSVGHVVITGAFSKWTNSVSLGIGGFNAAQFGGVGNVTVADGAILEVQGPTTFWSAGGKIDVKGGRFVTSSLVTNSLTNATVALSDPDDDLSALTIGTGGDSTTFPGTISNGSTGPGGITKLDGGTVTFTGPLSFTGPIRVLGGKLVVPQSFPFATITNVTNGSSLEFAGTWGTNTFSQMTIAGGSKLVASGTLKGSVTNAGVIIDRTSVITSITKVGELVTIGSPVLYGGHFYQLQAANAADAPFSAIGSPFSVPVDQPTSTDLGEIVPQRFYRWKVD